jgi:hypothetical protein
MRCDQVLDYYGDPDGPVGTVHRFPYDMLVRRLTAYFAGRPENPFKPTVQP